MSLKHIGRYSTFLLFLFVLGIRVEVYGQVAGGEIAKDIAANSQSLRQYTYLQTTEVILKGEVKNTRKAQVHYDSTGQKGICSACFCRAGNRRSRIKGAHR